MQSEREKGVGGVLSTLTALIYCHLQAGPFIYVLVSYITPLTLSCLETLVVMVNLCLPYHLLSHSLPEIWEEILSFFSILG